MECQCRVKRIHAALAEIIPSDVAVERVADGFGFTEGPVWIKEGFLLFSDIPNNVIYKWDSTQGVSEFLKSSGYDGHAAPAGSHIGSNGLTLDRQGKLIICEHGSRRLTRLENDGRRTVLADKYDGKRLNSPNDVVCKSDGALYFTDPPYGLLKRDADPARELPFNGVYRLTDARLQLLYDGLSRPNGLAFSPDEKHFFVANSDPRRNLDAVRRRTRRHIGKWRDSPRCNPCTNGRTPGRVESRSAGQPVLHGPGRNLGVLTEWAASWDHRIPGSACQLQLGRRRRKNSLRDRADECVSH